MAVAIMAAGCLGGQGYRAKGGSASYRARSGEVAITKQSENPKQAANQDVQVHDEQTFLIPFGSIFDIVQPGTTNVVHVTASAPVPVATKHDEISHSTVGASQKDTLGESLAMLKTAKLLILPGILLFVGGIFAALYPPATALFGGILPGIGIACAGLALIVLPFLIVGHPVALAMAAAGAGVAALAVWYIHHHGGLNAELAVLKTQLKAI